jgi:cytochrome P450
MHAAGTWPGISCGRWTPGCSGPPRSGLRSCPGAAHACALAEGAIEPLLARCRWTGAKISYPAPPALRAPARLEVAEA